MNDSSIRVRRATPGDVDNVAPLVERYGDDRHGPSPERVQYVFSWIVTQPNVEVYVAEIDGRIAAFLTVYYQEYLTRGGISATVPEVVVEPGPFRAQALRDLLERACQAAARRRCKRIDLYAGSEDDGLVQVARELGFEPSLQGLTRV